MRIHLIRDIAVGESGRGEGAALRMQNLGPKTP